ncbi:F6 fimbrial major subunit FasA [Escherichia coli]|uniref:Fimbrial protein 987P n=2 Tax=Escherichia coli TaxID=562 RepID=FM98_ECOLX|nr:F6 fimbrial major subunit FasA [Escherichia coli]P21413.1 RecName: Full=Fimbrial protein 987P; AltName: Full=Fimbrial adhesin 987P; Flags: Precursor [Escherichia coli]AAA23405.1 fimbriae 987P subunit precursor [Escherichia coli]AAB02684.1 FasA [Escherichia coli]EEU9342409.1 F6 fimbrial major subunit FasA [Escherichia coli]EEY9281603.1 F6 fimbrial major subunit FasA [Escherichia coli]EEY9366116.1 F6 fimbrial major subunit FasA [Escherichia coli]
MRMKKSALTLAVLSSLFSGYSLAAPAENNTSQANLDFTGKVTASLCQVDTSNLSQTIDLGELSTSALKATGKGPAKSFAVNLINCDTTLNSIKYTIAGNNNTGSDTKYLVPASNDTSASGVGVYIQDNNAQAVEIGTEKTVPVVSNGGLALSDQSIPLQAYIGTTTGNPDTNGGVTAGTVTASAVMTIRSAGTP